jgi:flagellar protein FliL
MARERDEENEKEEAPAQPKKKLSPKLLIIIGVVAALVIGGAGAGYFFFFMGKGKTSHSAEKKEAGGEKKGEKGEGAAGTTKNLEPFIVNLTDAQGTRYLKAVMQLELSSEELAGEIDEKIAMIRDDVISLLSSKSFEDISTEPGKRELKKALLERINRDLKSGQVTRIYFTEFVVQ